MIRDPLQDPFRQRARARPRYRGVLHSWCAVLAVPIGVALVLEAPTRASAFAVGVFAFSSWFMFFTSALFHRGSFDDHGWYRFRRVDHLAIFLCIAGSSTPFAMLVVDGWERYAMLLSGWLGASLGIFVRWAFFHPPFGAMNAAFIALGWAPLASLPALWSALGPVPTSFLLLEGLCYTVGALIVGARRPDPWPDVFGYHEVWHVLVALAIAIHYLVLAVVVLPQ